MVVWTNEDDGGGGRGWKMTDVLRKEMLVVIMGMVLWTRIKLEQEYEKKIAELEEGIVGGHCNSGCMNK